MKITDNRKMVNRNPFWAGCYALFILLVIFFVVGLGLPLLEHLHDMMPWTRDHWHASDFAQAEALISASLAKPLRPRETRTVALPANSALSTGGFDEFREGNKIYLYRTQEGVVLAYFIVYRDHDVRRGYVYCSRPLLPSDKEFSMDITDPPGLTFPREFPITRKINAHWYYTD